jgi:glycosyltransferase involved in cell wall biosynthesis
MRIIALTQVKDEQERIPGWLENVAPAVDGIVALDDGSTDDSASLLREHPKLLELMQNEPGGDWDERANQNALVRAGRRHGADWLLCLDADERLETRFVQDSHTVVEEAEAAGIRVLCFTLRELWGDPDHYRVDGLWDNKRLSRLFRNVEGHRRFDPRRWHRFWMPLELVADLENNSHITDFHLYHLSMIDRAEREQRVRKFEALDPENLYQRIGYRYLVDEERLELAAVDHRHRYEPRY